LGSEGWEVFYIFVANLTKLDKGLRAFLAIRAL